MKNSFQTMINLFIASSTYLKYHELFLDNLV